MPPRNLTTIPKPAPDAGTCPPESMSEFMGRDLLAAVRLHVRTGHRRGYIAKSVTPREWVRRAVHFHIELERGLVLDDRLADGLRKAEATSGLSAEEILIDAIQAKCPKRS